MLHLKFVKKRIILIFLQDKINAGKMFMYIDVNYTATVRSFIPLNVLYRAYVRKFVFHLLLQKLSGTNYLKLLVDCVAWYKYF